VGQQLREDWQRMKWADIVMSDISPGVAAFAFVVLMHVSYKKNERPPSGKRLIEERERTMAPNVAIFWKSSGGLVVEQAEGCYMVESGTGKRYLDCINNVAHVGHSHPRVVKVGQKALSQVQTNARFLHPIQQQYIQKLLSTVPKELNTVFFCCTGSEANDLALRIARAHTSATRGGDTIVIDGGYHGHTQALIDISTYKWRQATDGKNRKPTSTHVVSLPDTFRGPHRGFTAQSGREYAREVERVVEETGGVGVFISESSVGCGGQVLLPPLYLQTAYAAVRSKGGICIADEVQTGFGRCGKHMWLWQTHGVVPDIFTTGKPQGNGYPLAAVICKREVAESFASSGIEYFNTFGGNSVACTIGNEVLDIIVDEGLQEQALRVGEYLKEKLRSLAVTFASIGDVRGEGLFLGVDLVHDRVSLKPATELASHVVKYCMEEWRVMISTDGFDNNVLKIKPPLVFGFEEADILCQAIEGALLHAAEMNA